jgi:hypothetical protein
VVPVEAQVGGRGELRDHEGQLKDICTGRYHFL